MINTPRIYLLIIVGLKDHNTGLREMNVYLCPVKPRGWRIIKSRKLFGTVAREIKTFRNVQPGDLLVFHVLKPVNGIVSVCKVISDVFENHEDIWGKGRYPFRVRIEFIPNLIRNEKNPIPIGSIFGQSGSEGAIKIEPFLKNVWITKMSQEQYEKLQKLFLIQA